MDNDKKILIVDDSSLNIKILSDILKEKSYRITQAESGEMALKYSKLEKPDLILLDVMMPEIDGFEVCRRLKSDPESKNIPVIFISGLDESKYIVNGFKAGAVDYIIKPFQKEVVLARVNTHLKLNQTQQKLKRTNEEQNILVENIDFQVWYLHNAEKYGKANINHAKFMGLEKRDIENKLIKDFMNKEDAEFCIKENRKVFQKKKKLVSKKWMKNFAGEERLLKITRSPKLDGNNKVQYVVCSAIDITEKHRREKEIKYLSFHDEMTGLYNRRYFENELERLSASRQLPITILVADLDKLKFINDNYGHKMGDKYIKAAADLLNLSSRQEDVLARIGGDEFAMVLPDTDFNTAEMIFKRIKANLAEYNQQNQLLTKLKISIGFAVKEVKNQDLDQIFKEADKMMYNNKGKQIFSKKRVLSKNGG